ncbi:hypothetical protein NEOLI_002389 [Neolecta irregularis DAH-3]|uniref:Uncharacterized protein n=1 Tax=Neolecta irregularis (strain DAH-3) TaxID=1198029 RepID=A0A1U7LJC4_NEOID|nr:hypothetical protein NEOLI_002389 [Neolecta irregularis DAH-3]|eukprot:OLL22744.1 hypothetical protein NEOLI_002389 [Neolecta irregularis DAH-3]
MKCQTWRDISTSLISTMSSEAISELSPAELRKQRRETKILSSGNFRLSKITKTAFTGLDYEKDLSSTMPQVSDPEEVDISPSSKIEAAGHFSKEASVDFFKAFGIDSEQPHPEAFVQTSPNQLELSRNKLLWDLTHIFVSVFLVVYTFVGMRFSGVDKYSRLDLSTTPLFWIFIATQLALQVLQIKVSKNMEDPSSILSLISNNLPCPLGNYLSLLGKYSSMWSSLVDDLCILILGIGLISWFYM